VRPETEESRARGLEVGLGRSMIGHQSRRDTDSPGRRIRQDLTLPLCSMQAERIQLAGSLLERGESNTVNGGTNQKRLVNTRWLPRARNAAAATVRAAGLTQTKDSRNLGWFSPLDVLQQMLHKVGYRRPKT